LPGGGQADARRRADRHPTSPVAGQAFRGPARLRIGIPRGCAGATTSHGACWFRGRSGRRRVEGNAADSTRICERPPGHARATPEATFLIGPGPAPDVVRPTRPPDRRDPRRDPPRRAEPAGPGRLPVADRAGAERRLSRAHGASRRRAASEGGWRGRTPRRVARNGAAAAGERKRCGARGCAPSRRGGDRSRPRPVGPPGPSRRGRPRRRPRPRRRRPCRRTSRRPSSLPAPRPDRGRSR